MNEEKSTLTFPKLQGKIQRWDLIVIGHLRWNPYFGESEEAPPRGQPSTCTSTLIRGEDENGKPYALIVDPTLRHQAQDYYFDINRRTGLQPEDITHCFITHSHYDHQAGLAYFPKARHLAAPSVAAELANSEFIDGSKVEAVHGEFLPGLAPILLPGHRHNLHGIAFTDAGRKVLVTADAVMTRDHFEHETCQFEEDSKLAAATIRSIKKIADLIVCGHDNVLFNRLS